MSYSEKNQKKSEIPKSLYENISQKIWTNFEKLFSKLYMPTFTN